MDEDKIISGGTNGADGQQRDNDRHSVAPKLYLAVTGLAFAALTIVFVTFPRSTYSELEKRELDSFPAFTTERLFNGTFTSDVSQWFSDSEPYRDQLMALSMGFKDLIRLNTNDEEQVTFIASSAPATEDQPSAAPEGPSEQERAEGIVPEEVADENAKIANAGIVVVGTGDKVRAMMAFGGGPNSCLSYADAANKYKETFPDVNVYSMIVPISIEFYCPEKVKRATKPQRPAIENAMNHLNPSVKAVDIYWTLKEHSLEDIYLRTDHHWTPLGAYYAAKKFAEVAGVPFPGLDSYEQRVVHRIVGSMYGYSRDVSVKNAPEDFIYYVPQGVDYETTYVNYVVDRSYHVIGEGRPYTGPFFYKFADGNGGAYCTFMGSDMKLTQVRTSTHNGRRLLILKDSFGNALPGYMFFSFEEVHVVDMRYFKKNMVSYVRDNHITDILFANNIFNAASHNTYKKCVNFLTQNGSMDRPAATQPADSNSTSAPPVTDIIVTEPSENTDEQPLPNTEELTPAAELPTVQPNDTL